MSDGHADRDVHDGANYVCPECGGLWAKLYVTPSGLMCRACYPDARHDLDTGGAAHRV